MDLVSTSELTRCFGDFVAVNKVSVRVGQGEILGLLGCNGAGKTTLIRMLCGLLKPTSGTARVAGFDLHQTEMIKQHIGYMGQHFSLFDDLTVLENMEFFGTIYGMGRKAIRAEGSLWLERLGVSSQARCLVKTLPSGWRQALAFSVAMLHQPGLVFLDEPTSGLDSVSRRKLWNLIYTAAAGGTSVVVSTHYLDEASYCHRIAIMEQGRIRLEGTPEHLRQEAPGHQLINLFAPRPA